MVIWLRNPKAEGAGAGAGAGADDIVRAGELSTLVDVDAAYVELQEIREEAIQMARIEAGAIVEAATAEATGILAAARRKYDGAATLGYEAGFEQGLSEWQERAMRAHAAAQTLGSRRRERLAQLVALAVEQIVSTVDSTELFARAASTIEQIVADGSPVRFAVHPADLPAARAAFDDAARRWREAGIAVRLLPSGDTTLERGACVIETDLGALDASLPQQLGAMRAALTRAMEQVPEAEFEDELQVLPDSETGIALDDAEDKHGCMEGNWPAGIEDGPEYCRSEVQVYEDVGRDGEISFSTFNG
ncbi:HrpE/YscL family type III secretion apparatus protein [Burkholderia sp. Ac-20384]|uniref:type III secretion system stator protein SctL n=1 Tax=Burkholderia sp. Ac-20384 TaxID=2703902 RepID=UPI00197CFE95|nr:type III secretion system stator protein SctL [Burkholderia sp. Ac-20384]MBN3825131.1 HrpE/YscL family type III secretion apparatus protein [Burkholderia sp. Ac-20384]